MSEHQKLQEARRKDYEIIEVPYRHLKQVIIGDETLEQTKAALEEFKTNEELKAAGLRFNPNLARWLNVARDRIIRWERDNPKPEPKIKPKTKAKKEPKSESKTEDDKKLEREPEKEPEETSSEEEPKDESEETPEEVTEPIGEETDTVEKVEEDPEPKEPEVE